MFQNFFYKYVGSSDNVINVLFLKFNGHPVPVIYAPTITLEFLRFNQVHEQHLYYIGIVNTIEV